MNRLAGAALIAPVVNYWWRGFPSNLSKEAYYMFQPPQDQWALRVAHYAPWLTYWWNTRKLFPGLSLIAHNPGVLSKHDLELISRLRSIREVYQVILSWIHEHAFFQSGENSRTTLWNLSSDPKFSDFGITVFVPISKIPIFLEWNRN